MLHQLHAAGGEAHVAKVGHDRFVGGAHAARNQAHPELRHIVELAGRHGGGEADNIFIGLQMPNLPRLHRLRPIVVCPVHRLRLRQRELRGVVAFDEHAEGRLHVGGDTGRRQVLVEVAGGLDDRPQQRHAAHLVNALPPVEQQEALGVPRLALFQHPAGVAAPDKVGDRTACFPIHLHAANRVVPVDVDAGPHFFGYPVAFNQLHLQIAVHVHQPDAEVAVRVRGADGLTAEAAQIVVAGQVNFLAPIVPLAQGFVVPAVVVGGQLQTDAGAHGATGNAVHARPDDGHVAVQVAAFED